MKTGYRKILRDIWSSKGRTILVVLSITVGVFAIGLVAAMTDYMINAMTDIYRASQPAHLTVFMRDTISDESVLDSLSRLSEVTPVEGFTQITARWRPDPDTPWRDARITVRQDYDNQLYNKLKLLSGQWPVKRTVAVEDASIKYFNIAAQGSITFLIDDHEHTLPISGLVNDLQAPPPSFGGDATFYISQDQLASWYGEQFFNQIRTQVPVFSQEVALQAGEALRERLDDIGLSAGFTNIQNPNEHFNQDIVDSLLLILRVLAALSLMLGLFLVINTINAIVAQQVPQIGVMKAVGAMNGQVTRLYLSGVLIYGVLALLIAIPLGAALSFALSRALLNLLNVSLDNFHVSTQALTQQLGVGLLAPALAALWPVISGARITVREAISTYGIGTDYGASIFDRVIARLRRLPRPLALTLRNTFRHKARVALTQITLTIAGAVFIMVLSASESFTYTIDFVFNTLGLDINLGFSQFVRIDEAEATVREQPGVAYAEAWMFRGGTALRHEDDPEGERINVRALPPETQLFQPVITSGRWLDPNDGHAMVMNSKLANTLGLQAGQQVTLDFDNGELQSWTIVGTVFDLSAGQSSAYVPRDVFLPEFGLSGRTSNMQIRTTSQDAAFEAAVADNLRTVFDARSIGVGGTFTGAEGRQQNQSQFDILVTLLLVMSGLIALVGSIGLAGTLSINVLERRREIGVMRAIGASSRMVAGLFVGEGMLLGLLSWLIAVPLSVPAGMLFAEAIGDLFDFQMIYRFAWDGMLIWLFVVVVLSIAASALPALRAAQVSVRESLAFE